MASHDSSIPVRLLDCQPQILSLPDIGRNDGEANPVLLTNQVNRNNHEENANRQQANNDSRFAGWQAPQGL